MSNTELTINRWAAWMPGIATRQEWQDWQRGERQITAGESPSVRDIPPMLRRRLSPLGKMALSVAWPLLADGASLPSLFCSRHGELERTVGMLRNLARHEDLSPTHFSLSVHNAIGGVYSIARKDTAAISALAVGDEGFSEALLETRLIMAEQGAAEALCLVYDAPVPEVYSEFAAQPAWPYAAAFVLGAVADGEGALKLSMNLQAGPPQANAAGDEPQALRFLRFLLDARADELELPHGPDRWRWEKRRAGA